MRLGDELGELLVVSLSGRAGVAPVDWANAFRSAPAPFEGAEGWMDRMD